MKIFSKFYLLCVTLLLSLPASAVRIDFTASDWMQAINMGGAGSAMIGDITLTSVGGNLTFNGSSSERNGCLAGVADHRLACDGDGIGIRNDEITEGGFQQLLISFSRPMMVTNLFVLDLFGSERSGEIAIVNGNAYEAAPGNNGVPGGFWETGYSANGITQILLTGNQDYFSDYALAAIDVAPVPLPGALVLLLSGLIGLGVLKRRASA